MTDKWVCIPGHFYQPPRENPWLEAIEPQPSARPYRDWNERERAREQVYAEFADIELIRTNGRDHDDRDGIIHEPPAGAYKNQGAFTYPGCWLFDACELHEIGGDWQEMLVHSTREWDPYEEHEVYADETH